jgi:CRISPR/Cas system endoribonuclease Cas6 (RAMP superfamily)
MELDYRGLIARAGTVVTKHSSLEWVDWERYSNRQRTKMTLGGFVGEVEYEGEAIEEFLPLIAAGEVVHVGTGSSFGLGNYRIASVAKA